MDVSFKALSPSIEPLPIALSAGLLSLPPGLPKRERTRAQLVDSAIKVFSVRGVAAGTIQEIADVAGMTTGTVYNHFKTKEEVLSDVALRLATTLCTRITESQQGVKEGAERMAIGGRRYAWLAEVAPQWALLMLDVAAAAPELLVHIREYVLADLRLGVKQKAFRIASEEAAMDLINGTGTHAMRTIALGLAPPTHGADVAACVLRGLGVPHEKAEEIARRPLPDFPAPGVAAAAASRKTAPRRAPSA
ncbi:transcriptional regulator, TetR family [Variovorax sp. OV329]|nr:transcriptional regulator, TetR family [Variovorax sp. OV329]